MVESPHLHEYLEASWLVIIYIMVLKPDRTGRSDQVNRELVTIPVFETHKIRKTQLFVRNCSNCCKIGQFAKLGTSFLVRSGFLPWKILLKNAANSQSMSILFTVGSIVLFVESPKCQKPKPLIPFVRFFICDFGWREREVFYFYFLFLI